MDNHWTNPPEFRSLPWGPRIWLWWCRRGPKRIGGGTVGGNRLFSICRWMLGRWPAGIDNLYPVHSRQRGMTIFIDLLDFEAYQHTVRLFSGGGTESVLQRCGKVFLALALPTATLRSAPSANGLARRPFTFLRLHRGPHHCSRAT